MDGKVARSLVAARGDGMQASGRLLPAAGVVLLPVAALDAVALGERFPRERAPRRCASSSKKWKRAVEAQRLLAPDAVDERDVARRRWLRSASSAIRTGWRGIVARRPPAPCGRKLSARRSRAAGRARARCASSSADDQQPPAARRALCSAICGSDAVERRDRQMIEVDLHRVPLAHQSSRNCRRRSGRAGARHSRSRPCRRSRRPCRPTPCRRCRDAPISRPSSTKRWMNCAAVIDPAPRGPTFFMSAIGLVDQLVVGVRQREAPQQVARSPCPRRAAGRRAPSSLANSRHVRGRGDDHRAGQRREIDDRLRDDASAAPR